MAEGHPTYFLPDDNVLAQVNTILGHLTGWHLSICKLTPEEGGHLVYVIFGPPGGMILRRLDELPCS